MAKKTKTVTNSTFEVNEDFLGDTEGGQDKAVRAFFAANPKARIEPKEVGQTAPFLRRQNGKRFSISERINQGGDAREIIAFDRENGGFSRTSKFYGQSIITLHAV